MRTPICIDPVSKSDFTPTCNLSQLESKKKGRVAVERALSVSITGAEFEEC